jgi:hypothetical protein
VTNERNLIVLGKDSLPSLSQLPVRQLVHLEAGGAREGADGTFYAFFRRESNRFKRCSERQNDDGAQQDLSPAIALRAVRGL